MKGTHMIESLIVLFGFGILVLGLIIFFKTLLMISARDYRRKLELAHASKCCCNSFCKRNKDFK